MQTINTVNTFETVLNKHPFLAGLAPQFCDSLSNCACLRRFAARQQIFHEGGEADHFYLIVSGKVDLETFVPGCGMVTIQTLGDGDALGWSWLFPPHQWHFTATTREPTEVISLNAAALRAQAEANRGLHDELVTRVAKTLHQRLLGTREQLIDLYGIRP